MDSTSSKIYLDYNATTPLATEVVDCVTEALTDAWANPSSSTDIGRKAKELIDQSRKKIATMLNAEASEVIFLSGGTEANNMVLQTALKYFKSWAGKSMQMSSCKPHIVTTNVEHDAILLPLKHFEEEQQADVDYVPVSSTYGQVLAEEIEKQIRPHTCLVTVMLANNETGVIMPVAEISRKIRKLNEIRQMEGLCRILLHTDAAQAIGKITVDAKELGVDYLTVVGHKFYGPRIGAVYVKNLGDSKIPLYPMFFGGGQEQKFRPGTENTPMIHGLGCAAELISRNLKIYQGNMMKMRDLLEQSLAEEFGENVIVNCNAATRLPNTSSVSFRKTAFTGGEILSRCPELMASTGAACHGTGKPSEILMASGVTFEDARSAVRLSVGRDTTSKQIEQTVLMLKTAVNLLD
ncbi:selenocysteine lyase-like isoform X1 [Daphnia pulex]|uniref:selenocysteine lyase-like isoform X1 n=2 Tax=Daphnia pulex TaxID=6669 RepID=UPI001EDF1DED|nr:selenocysteine lyase-like isoform X1 [Daphnia pulex]